MSFSWNLTQKILYDLWKQRHKYILPKALNSLSHRNHVYINFTCSLDKILGQLRKKSQLRDFPDQFGLRTWLLGIVLMVNWCKRGSPLWDASFPGQVIMSCIRNLSMPELVSQPETCILHGFSGTHLTIKRILGQSLKLCEIASDPACELLFAFPPWFSSMMNHIL